MECFHSNSNRQPHFKYGKNYEVTISIFRVFQKKPNKVNHVWESKLSTHLIHNRVRNSENTMATETIPTTISLVTSGQSEKK